MKKEFNITGTCHAEDHYMMDDTRRFDAIIDLVKRNKYFVINRPRQYGKTTMLHALIRTLRQDAAYLPILMNFQGIGTSVYESDITFGQFFYGELYDALQNSEEFEQKEALAGLALPQTMKELSRRITEIVKMTTKKLVVLIDEVDASSNYDAFLHLLGTLRNKYLNRKDPQDYTFHSIVLAGVHDIKSLKFKLRNPEDAQTNSPWNIATDFKVVMEFNPQEIAHMLRQYSEAENVKINFEEISNKLYYYTSGYPFLVSKLCKTIAEDILPNKEDQSYWALDDLKKSVQLLLRERNTNFDSLIKNLENNESLFRFVRAIIIEGYKIPYDPNTKNIQLGEMYGIFSGNGIIKIHNRIYEQVLYNYLSNTRLEQLIDEEKYNFRDNYTAADGGLDLERVLRNFQAFMKEQYSKKDSKMLEREWRLIFLAFLKPIINGQGHDFKEVETSEEKRLDVVVTYLQWKYILELKRWSGEKSHQKGLKQLADYLDIHDVKKGYLLIFDERKSQNWKEERIQKDGKEIFAVWL
ncbi:MAG: AAA family ATPase [Bernardetiaceae bacterium]|nr:AAA family ATPase [Bernardetiaceae bacterium]